MERLYKVNYRRFGTLIAVVLAVSGLTAPTVLADQAARAAGPANTWIPASQMNTVRAGATATLLSDGKVLVAGGGTDTAELYNPATSSFTPTGKMPVAVAFATATLLRSGDVLVAGGEHGSNSRQVANAELYDPSTGTWTATGAMNTARSGQTATLLPNGDVLVAGGGCNIGHQCDAGSFLTNLASAELYDPSTGTWTKTGKMHTPREYATASLLPDGQVLEAGGFVSCDDDFCVDARSAELYDPSTATWTKTGSMHFPRERQTATLLPDGQVLVAGGLSENGGFTHRYASAELYDPSTGTWTATARMSTPHVGGTATLLSNGWVLVAGGHTSVAEIYEPKPAIWVRPGAMSTVRTDQTATLLLDGHVLVTGGTDRFSDPQSTAEVFLAGTGPLVSIAPSSIAFGGQQVGTTSAGHTFTVSNVGSGNLVSDGVEVTGRNPSDFRVSTTCSKAPVAPGGTCTVSVRFGPASTGLRTAVLKLSDNAPLNPQPVTVNGYGGGPNAWVPVGPLPAATENASAVLLHNGEVLIAGGNGDLAGDPIASAELYNPATRTFTATGSLNAARVFATAVLLQNGEVLIAGGQDASQNPMASTELYNPATGTWSNAAPMLAPGAGITSTLLPNGNVLVTGFFLGVPDNRGEVYDPATNTWTSTGVMPSQQFVADAILLPDGKVLLCGGGTKAAELYDPGTNTWTATGSMVSAQQGPLATLLPGGEVEVAGGTVPHTATPVSSTELYDPTTGTWSKGFPLTFPRYAGTATLLPDGTALAAGGCNSCDLGSGSGTSTTLLFRDDQFWDANANMTQPRVFQTATLLPGGDVLVAGGGTCLDCVGTATAELYTPTLVSVSPSSGPVGTHVTITANGFYAHEVVRLSWDNQNIGFPKASADGTVSFEFTIPQAAPGGHTISANGQRSFAAASTTFTVTS